MKPISFPQANTEMRKPAQLTDEQCGSLMVYRGEVGGQPVFLSCFSLSDDELMKVIETKKVWLYVFGNAHPPVAIDTSNPWRQDG